jgi:hypothetical protein
MEYTNQQWIEDCIKKIDEDTELYLIPEFNVWHDSL